MISYREHWESSGTLPCYIYAKLHMATALPNSNVVLPKVLHDIQDKDYKISVVYSYDEYGIFRRADSLSIDDDNKVSIIGNYTTSMESYADISLHGITIPRNLFVDFNSKDRSRFIEFPLPTILVLDIYDKADLNLNSARTDIIADDKWKLFEKRIVLILCEKLRVFVIPYFVQIQLSFLSGNCSFHCHN